MGNSASSLPYTIGAETHHPKSRPHAHGWSIHTGNHNDSGDAVTVFKASKPSLAKTPLKASGFGGTGGADMQIFPALHHFHKVKSLRHPNVVRVLASLDTDYPDGKHPGGEAGQANPLNLSNLQSTATTGDLIIVTEPVVPLEDYLDSLPKNSPSNADAIAYGLHNLISALGFLHNTAKLAHGALSPSAVFVTPSGDFKLSEFSVVTPVGIEDGGGGPTAHFRQFEGAVTPMEYRSPERVEGRWDAIQSCAIHPMDSFALGVLIKHIYSHSHAGTGGVVPQKLQKAVGRLVTPNIKMRPRVVPLLKCPVFANPHVDAQLFLDNIAAKPSEEKISFLLKLPDMLQRGVLSEGVAVHKVLPVCTSSVELIAGNESMIAQDVNRREVLAVIPPLFHIAEHYLLGSDKEEFDRRMPKVIGLLFQINDRGVRGALLSRVTVLSSQLDKKILNSSVFEPMCSGFTDSSAPLRELTLKSTIVLVPHLTPANLEKLVRYLVRLQGDPESSIRTNTVIFIGKIAPNLSEVSRSKLILPAFTRAMQDSFTPCRLAALKSVWVCREYFDSQSVAKKVLPAVVPHLTDAVGEVREESFRVVDAFVGTLREESRRMASGAAEEGGAHVGGLGGVAPAAAGAPAPAPAPASGGYLSGLSSWATGAITSSAKGDDSTATPIENGQATGSVTPAAAAPQPAFSSLSLSDARIGGIDPLTSATNPTANAGDGGGWSDDDDDDVLGDGVNFGASSTPKVTTPDWVGGKTTGSATTNTVDDDDFFSSFDSKPKISGLGSANRSSGGKLAVPKKTMAQKKAELAERKAQRAAQRKAGGGTGSGAVGAKKLTGAAKLVDDGGGIDDGWDDF